MAQSPARCVGGIPRRVAAVSPLVGVGPWHHERAGLAVKFSSYAHYLDSREWASEGARLPRLLAVAPEVAQERRIQRVAQAKLVSATGFVIWTTTAGLLHEQGPLAPIWFACLPAPYRGAHPGLPRRCFIEMNLLK